jgi:hypothetical protein
MKPIKHTFIIALILIFGFGIIYILLKPSVEPWSIDSDHDGLVDQVDQEDSTRWIADTSRFPLNQYVNELGFVDSTKTQPLCDCWEFPNIQERMILKCQDNAQWFVFNWQLINFQNGRFYRAKNELIPTNNDDHIELYHEKLFGAMQIPPINPNPSDPVSKINPNVKVEWSYNGKTYRIKQGFLSEEGMEWNACKWRYINNTWEKAPNPDNPKFSSNGVTQRDIDFFLSRNATVVSRNNHNTTNTGTNNGSSSSSGNSNTQTNTGNSNAGNSTTEELTQDDLYWISFLNGIQDKDPTDTDKTEVKNNRKKKKNLTKKGKMARARVIHLIDMF